jgi:serine/threonine protein kinase
MSDSIRHISPERWARAQELLEQIWRLPNAAARERALADACRDDPALASQVRRLYAADRAPSPIDQNIAGDALRLIAAQEGLQEDLSGTEIGNYRLVRKLGEGGMGVVYLGERNDGMVDQRVAVKLLRSRAGSDLEQTRFRIEQQVLAALDHPAIASLYDAGRTADGQAWFVMEYVEGERITDYCRERSLSVAARLRLVREVAEALQYAHQRLIVHRDVKPSNLLVTPQGRVKLLDFGIAKLIGDGDGKTTITQSNERPMTLEYAAPEQIRGQEVSVQTDVYQLGVVLYELLTGVRPFRRDDGDLYGVAREICERGAERPSVAVSERSVVWYARRGAQAAADASADVAPAEGHKGTDDYADARSWRHRQRRRLRGDLDAIVMQAMARDLDERYRSMEALAADLRAYQEDRPVSARPYSLAYSSWLFLRRHPWSTAAAGLFVAVLVGWAGTATLQSRRTAEAYELARAEAAKASQTASFLENIFLSWDPNESPGEQILVRDMLERARAQLYQELESTPDVRSRLMYVLAGLYKSLGLYHDQVQLARDSLDIRRGLYQAPDPRLIDSALLLGEGLTEVGRFEDARAEFEYALAQARTLDDDRPVTASGHGGGAPRALVDGDQSRIATLEGSLAFTLHSVGAYSQARERYGSSLDRFRAAGDTENLSYAGILSNYAKLLDTLGEFEQALEANGEALGIYQRRYGRRHHEVAVLLNQRGYLMTRERRLDVARQLHEEALEIQLERLSPTHEFVASTRIDLGRVLAQTGAYPEARSQLQLALSIRQSVYGEFNAHTAEARFALGTVLRDMGDLDGALAEYEAARAVDREIFGADHANVGMDETRMASVLAAQGRFTDAAALYVAALEKLPAELVFRSTALFGYGKVLIELGKPETAGAYLQEALDIRERVVPAGHPRLTEIEDVLKTLTGARQASDS